MNTETITAQFVDPPKPGKKLGSVKTTDGRRFGFDPSRVSLQQGGTYTVQTSSRDWQGKTYFNIEGVVNGGGGSGAAPAQQQPARRDLGVGSAKPNGNDSRMIFITGVVGRAMGSGNFSIGDLTNLTLAAAEAYAALDGGGDPRPEPPPHESDAPF